jgi:hypothetical protein
MPGPVFDTLLVAIIVALACAHVAWQLLPTMWRVPAAARIASRLAAHDDASQLRRWLLRALRAPSAGCGDCGGRTRCPAQALPTRQAMHDVNDMQAPHPIHGTAVIDPARIIARSGG